jgi:hypothetical protein
MLQHVFYVVTVDLRCCNMFFYVVIGDLRCSNMFFFMLYEVSVRCKPCSWMLQAMINIWSICLSFHLSPSRTARCGVCRRYSKGNHHYRGLLLHQRRKEGAVEVGRVERKPLDPKEKERNWSLSIRKGRSVRVGQVERKHLDQLFISGCPDASISQLIIVFLCVWRYINFSVLP